MKKVLNKVGQSTLEYVVVFTAIIAAILFATVTFFKPHVGNLYAGASGQMNASSALFQNSIGAGVGGGAAAGTAPSGGTAPIF